MLEDLSEDLDDAKQVFRWMGAITAANVLIITGILFLELLKR